jgi:hypothetical protein
MSVVLSYTYCNHAPIETSQVAGLLGRHRTFIYPAALEVSRNIVDEQGDQTATAEARQSRPHVQRSLDPCLPLLGAAAHFGNDHSIVCQREEAGGHQRNIQKWMTDRQQFLSINPRVNPR